MAKQKKEKKAKGGVASKALTAGGAVALALAVGVTGAGNFFSGVLDTYAGMGEAKVVQKPGSENWDTTYYATDYSSAEEIDKAAKATTKAIPRSSWGTYARRHAVSQKRSSHHR